MRTMLLVHLCLHHSTLAAAVLALVKGYEEHELSVLGPYATLASAEPATHA